MPAQSSRIKELFVAALDLPDAAARRAFLDQACGSDADLRQRLDALLQAHDAPASVLKQPLAALADAGVDMPVQPAATASFSVPEADVGTVIGPYKLLQQIGEGGMGTVYMAEQAEPVQRKVAIKLIKPGLDSRQVIARFEAERQALAVMDHPNIAKVHDAGTTQSGRPYFAMELVKGIPITKYCDQEHLTPRERLELFIPICQAVQHAHQKGIIHRDLKPSNVIVGIYDGKPVPKVIDFGVAKATAQKLTERTVFTEVGQIIGTLEYMAPEQAELNNLDIDTRADIYSLGVILYELLTGYPPFTAKELRQAGFEGMLRMIREIEPPKPSTRLSTSDQLPSIAANRKVEPKKLTRLVYGELDWVVMKCLEKDRGRRYETASGLARDIERYLADEAVQACPPSAGYRFKKFARRHKTALAASAVVAVSLLLGIAASTWQAFRATRAEEEANRQRDEAQANFRKAREAVDKYFTLVSEEQLLDMPLLQDFRKKLLETALGAYQEFLSQKGDDPLVLADLAAAHFRVAQIMFRIGHQVRAWLPHNRQAIEIIERLIAEQRDTPQVQQRLAGVYRGEADPVVNVYERSPQEGPREVLGYLVRMIAFYEKFVRDDPSNEVLRNDLAGLMLYAADTNGSMGRHEEAIAHVERAIAIWEELVRANPSYRGNLPAAYGVATYVYGALGRTNDQRRAVDRSFVLSEQLAKESPANANLQLQLAGCYRNKAQISRTPAEHEKDLRESLAILDALHKDYPTVKRYHLDWANARLELAELRKDFNGVKESYDRLEELGQLAWWQYKLRGAAHFQLKHYDKALADIAKAVELDPGDALWWIPFASVASCPDEGFRKGMLALADKTIERTGGKDGDAFLLRGSLYAVMGQHNSAAADLNKAIELNSAFAPLWNNVAWFLATGADSKVRDPKRAVEMAMRAIKLAPKEGSSWNTLGVAHYRAGDWKAALDALVKSMEVRKGGDSFDWFFLAMAHWQLGQRDEARKWYKKSVEWMEKNNPRDEELIRFRAEAEGLLGVKK
jgi:serine/threonine protein kinase/tetratricopeptide (TPR) repeat protein